jgi:ubiquinone biosynthesis protein Coq4
MADVPYLLRGVKTVPTESSMLVSSSKYLSSPRLREWIAMITLRRNGDDFPPQAEMYDIVGILSDLQDKPHIEELFREERRKNPRLDAWFEEGFMSNHNPDDFRAYPEGTLGCIFYRKVLANAFELEIYKLPTPKTQLEFFNYRSAQTHDFEHVITGGNLDYMGELVPYWCRITNLFKHLSPELAGELSVMQLLGSLRYTVRTMLHYPQVWPTCQSNIERGMKVGHESGPIFMNKYEDALHLPLEEARRMLGVVGAVDIDTSAPSDIWAERITALAAE